MTIEPKKLNENPFDNTLGQKKKYYRNIESSEQARPGNDEFGLCPRVNKIWRKTFIIYGETDGRTDIYKDSSKRGADCVC